MTLGQIISILTFTSILWIDVNSDFKRIGLGKKINHSRGFILRSLAMSVTFGCLLYPLDNLRWWYILLKSLTIIILISSWWWEFFDGWLNLKRGKSWRYTGTDDEDDSATDNILQKMTSTQQLLLKWGCIVLSTSVFILWFS